MGERGVVVGEWEWTVERRREREGGWQLAVSGGHMARVNAEVGRGGPGEQEQERGSVPDGTAAWRLRALLACCLGSWDEGETDRRAGRCFVLAKVAGRGAHCFNFERVAVATLRGMVFSIRREYFRRAFTRTIFFRTRTYHCYGKYSK